MSTNTDLPSRPWRFSLFAALRELEHDAPDGLRLGDSRRIAEDAVRIGQVPHVTFAPSDVLSLEALPRGGLRLAQHSFGLLGPNGPLPLHLTEIVFDRRNTYRDPGPAAFLDVFHHRLSSLFYRAWADSEPTVGAGRAQGDPYQDYLRAIAGLGLDAVAAMDRLPVSATAFHADALGRPTRSAERLLAILSDYFQLPCRLRPFVGSWLEVPEEERFRLRGRHTANCLGLGATLGGQSWQCQHRFEVIVGPLSRPQFESLLPGSPALTALAHWIQLYTHDEWSWQLRLLLLDTKDAGVRLARQGRLGWSSWLGERQVPGDEVVLQGDTLNAAPGAAQGAYA